MRTSARSVVPRMMKMSFKMLGSKVTTMTVEGGSITGVPVSAGCQALEKGTMPLLLSVRALMQLNLICNHRLLWLLTCFHCMSPFCTP